MDTQKETAKKFQSLFEIMLNEHNLILTISEMVDIIIVVQKVLKLLSKQKFINNKRDICKHNERVYINYKSKKENNLKEKRVENICLNSSPKAVKAILDITNFKN